jgi:periplasmic protein TonB
MRWSVVGYAVSAGVHVAAMSGMFRIPASVGIVDPIVTVFDAPSAKKTKVEPKEKAPEKPPIVRENKPVATKVAAARTDNTPPPPTGATPPPTAGAAHAALDALPDFGLSLGGLSVDGPGIAVPIAGMARPAAAVVGGGQSPKEVKAKVLSVKQRPADEDPSCDEEATKPKQQDIVRPQYTDDARAAGVEGKVRVEITISKTGEVTSARVVSGLGHGLDEAAITAAKRMTFAPATRCGKPVESKFTISIRFGLVD